MARDAQSKNDPPSANETVTLTIEQLRTLIGEASRPGAPAQQNMDEMFEQHQRAMADARGRVKKAWYLAFVSQETRACGVAYVSVSRTHATGRVLSLPEYRFPEGHDRSVANGGLCALAELNDKNGQPTALYKQWKFTTFWQRDLRMFVGADASRLHTVGPARPTLQDSIGDLNDYLARPAPVAAEPEAPAIVAREVAAP
jgi:hypothetical protein